EHLNVLRKVFTQLTGASPTVNLAKCDIGRDMWQYLLRLMVLCACFCFYKFSHRLLIGLLELWKFPFLFCCMFGCSALLLLDIPGTHVELFNILLLQSQSRPGYINSLHLSLGVAVI
ncbi:hypothetical protein AMECASPLE_037302, partial [Ameca splendens]